MVILVWGGRPNVDSKALMLRFLACRFKREDRSMNMIFVWPDQKKNLQVYIEGYLQAMLDSMFRQDYLKVKVTDEEVRYHILESGVINFVLFIRIPRRMLII